MRAKRPLFPVIGSGLCFLLVVTGVVLGLEDGPRSTWRLVLGIITVVLAASSVVIIGISTRSKKRHCPPRESTAGSDTNQNSDTSQDSDPNQA